MVVEIWLDLPKIDRSELYIGETYHDQLSNCSYISTATNCVETTEYVTLHETLCCGGTYIITMEYGQVCTLKFLLHFAT